MIYLGLVPYIEYKGPKNASWDYCFAGYQYQIEKCWVTNCVPFRNWPILSTLFFKYSCASKYWFMWFKE